MKKMLITMVILIAIPVVGQGVDPVSLHGRWGGTVSQKGVRDYKDHTFNYMMSVHITQLLEGEVSGTATIAEVGCRGFLTFLYHADGVFHFMSGEPTKLSPKIKDNDCVPGVMTVKVLTADKIEVATFFATPSNPRFPSVQGTLMRLAPVEGKKQVEQ
jgi:hypothetical protein